MEYKLDLKDKKLLHALLQDSNVPLKDLASTVGLSKNSVLYRIEKLKKDGIIEKFHPVLNMQSLGYYTYDVFLKYKATEAEDAKIKNMIKKSPNVQWAASLFGAWDMFVQIITSGDFTAALEDILSYFGGNLEQYEVKTSVYRIKVNHQIFDLDEKEIKYTKIVPKVTKQIEIDELDRKILSYLSSVDALSNYREVAKSVGSSPETARNRIRRLYKEGVILYSMPFIVHKKIGIRSYIVNITFRNMTPEKEKELEQYISSSSKIKIAFRSQGKLEVYFWVITEEIEELERLLRDMKNRFFNEILDTSFNLVTEELKLNFFPDALMIKNSEK